MKGLILIVLLCALINIGSATDYNVDVNTSIQSVINNASNGDTIYVCNGTYNENIVIGKSISLVGNNTTIYGNSSLNDVINVTVDNVNISGFSINSIYNGDESGIHLYKSNNSIIFDNTISIGYENYNGIKLDKSNNVRIINNEIYDNEYGIRLEYSSNNTITNNNVMDNRYRGIYLRYNSSDNIIADNNISGNRYHGVSLYRYCNNNTVVNNTINYNGRTDGSGVYMSYICNYNSITDNTIQYNINRAIYIRDGSADTKIIGNNVSYNDGNGNSNAIHVYCSSAAPCNRTIIKDNVVCDNQDIYNAAIYVYKANDNRIINNTVSGHNNSNGAISLCISDDTIISDNNVSFNTGMIYGGITVYSGENNTITRNIAVNNTEYNIYLMYGGDNLIYDNYIGGNVSIFGINMVYTWNVTNTTGPNIVGGPFIGGNYYTDYTGNDSDGDGFGGYPYFIPNPSGSNNHDWLPLVMLAAEEPILCGDVNCDITINVVDVIEVYKRVCDPGYLLACANAADVNCDTTINVVDVIEVYKKVCNPNYELNCC